MLWVLGAAGAGVQAAGTLHVRSWYRQCHVRCHGDSGLDLLQERNQSLTVHGWIACGRRGAMVSCNLTAAAAATAPYGPRGPRPPRAHPK